MERIMLEQAKVLVLRHHDEVWTRGIIDAVDEIFAPDFVGHHPGQPDWVGPDAVKPNFDGCSSNSVHSACANR